MKSPPEQYTDEIARKKTEEFIAKYGSIIDTGGNGKKPKGKVKKAIKKSRIKARAAVKSR